MPDLMLLFLAFLILVLVSIETDQNTEIVLSDELCVYVIF